jgi:cation transport regulator ChaC
MMLSRHQNIARVSMFGSTSLVCAQHRDGNILANLDMVERSFWHASMTAFGANALPG